MCMLLLSPRNSTWLTSLHFTSKQNHFAYITSVHSTSLHFTPLHLFTPIPTPIPLLVTTFLTLFIKVFSLQGKDDSKPTGNWVLLLKFLFTKGYLLLFGMVCSYVIHRSSQWAKCWNGSSLHITSLHNTSLQTTSLIYTNPHFNSITCNYILNPLSKSV